MSINTMTKDEKLKALKVAKDKINKDFGSGSLMKLSEKQAMDPENVISTSSVGLDIALGVGGLPKGRIVEIYGPESSGKTTLAIHVMAEAQKKGGMCAFVDVEHAFDKTYAAKLGVNVDELEFSQPDYGEQALEIVDRLVNTGVFDVIVIDSIAALIPKAELDGEMGENKMGLHARLMSQACRKLTGAVSKTNTLVIFINQLREKIGVMFGSPEVTTGGNAMKFYASVRLDVRRSTSAANTTTDATGNKVGNLTTVKVVKNKVAPPFRTCEFDVLYGIGIDKFKETIELAVEMDVIKKSGSWFSYAGDKIGQGMDSVTKLMHDNEELFLEIKEKVIHIAYHGKDVPQESPIFALESEEIVQTELEIIN